MLEQTPLLSLSVIIPAYNEEIRLDASLRSLLSQLPAVAGNDRWEIVVANDGSTDRTDRIVEEIQSEEPRIRLLNLLHRGKGAAVRSGVLESRGERIIFSDADLATPFSEARKLLDALDDGADVAIGSRAVVGSQRLDEPFLREAMGRIFHFAVCALLMPHFADTQCGFKAFRRQPARNVFQRLALYNDDSPVLTHPAVTAFDVEVLYVANLLGYKIEEIPIEWHYQPASKVNPLRDSYLLIRDVLSVRSNARRHVYDSGREVEFETHHGNGRLGANRTVSLMRGL